jgi:acyl carrier protein
MRADNLEKMQAIVKAVLELPEGSAVEAVRQVATRRWDSLAQVSMIAAIESEFGIALSTDDYDRMSSYKAIVLLLEEKGF